MVSAPAYDEHPSTGDLGRSRSSHRPTPSNGQNQQDGDDRKPDYQPNGPNCAVLKLHPGQYQNHDGCHPPKGDELSLLSLAIRI
jgi:hypothetical protein